jgi:hypothetical protein
MLVVGMSWLKRGKILKKGVIFGSFWGLHGGLSHVFGISSF